MVCGSNRLFSNLFSFFAVIACLGLAGCGGNKIDREAKYPTGAAREMQADQNDIYSDEPSIFGENGLTLFDSTNNDSDNNSGTSGIGVNSFLWRASLDTVSFMPLASADPFGGVILTDWYAPPETPNERFKLNVFILDRQLRSDGVQVKVFRQVRRNGSWVDSSVSDDTGHKLEDAILTRARQMRVSQMNRSKK